MADEMEEIINDFVTETTEVLDSLDDKFVSLETSGDDPDLINDIFRSVHTVKGAAGFLGFQQIVDVAHRAETVMKKVRDGEMSMTREIIDVILHAVDMLKVLMGHVKARDDGREDIDALLRALEAAAEGRLTAAAPQPAPEPARPPARKSEPDELDMLIDEFTGKVEKALDEVDNSVIALEGGEGGAQAVKTTLAGLKTVLDMSTMFGYDQVQQVSKRLVALFDGVGKGGVTYTPEVRDVAIKALATLRTILGHIKARRNEKEDIDLLCVVLESAARPAGAAEEKAAPAEELPPETPRIGRILVEEGAISREDLDDALEEQSRDRKIGEILIEKKAASPDAVTRALEEQKKIGPAKAAPKEDTALNIRVDVKRLDSVMNLVGEMVLGRNRLTNLGTNLEASYPDDPDVQALMENLSFISLVTSDLQLAVMKTRMQPVRKVFSKFPRIVRDLSRKVGKEAELEIYGEDTELDKSVIEELSDPLVHLVRNSIDHGLESPEDRVRAGKNQTGKIVLSASQEGDHILIEISDDGRGMDIERIRQKAVEKGLVSENEAARMDEKHVLDFIFMAGFSTAAQQTELSGRGVGMDVVKTHISKLNGYVEASSERGKGSKIKISLPLTLAIVQALMVKVGNQSYALPLSPVNETLKVRPQEIKTIDGRPVITMRGQVIPIVDLAAVFGLPGAGLEARKDHDVYLVVVSLGERRFAILVDRLLGKEEVVIKNMKGLNAEKEGIAGATITGDGRVVLIVDLTVLLRELMHMAMS